MSKKVNQYFSDIEIVAPLARQLSWSHFLVLIPLKSKNARLFYANKAAESGWSKRKKLLEKKLHTALIEVRERLAERKLLAESDKII